ncbi:MAG: MmgE/PrpD family protein [Hyphomicrobiaceae bacterium]|nr:MmgE/PrpD family protein [Hyphomicrobiaceae bacterium]
MDAIHAFADHVARTRLEDLPEAAMRAAKTFILDTLGVGLAGSAGPKGAELAAMQSRWGGGADARVWGNGARLPAPAAALCNAYQAHCSEFDCVHEKAVVHAMTAVLAASLAGAERAGGVSGRDLILACTLGVDVAAGLGIASDTGLRFFRPATAGAFGATAALGKLMGLDAVRQRHAFSIVYGQVSGTMQAHTEGSMLLAMQLGFNTRNAVVACDLAAAGFEGPQNVLEGPFGYFRLIETKGDPGPVARTLGKEWRIAELAHKPFPSGRATHGIMDACLSIRSNAGGAFDPGAITSVTAWAPPLVDHLVGRPWRPDMELNYARLCARFVAARALIAGSLVLGDFSPAAYNDPATAALARRIAIEVRDTGDPNALTPVEVEIVMAGGSRHRAAVETVLGNPAKPLSRDAHLAKLRSNAAAALHPVSPDAVERLIEMVDGLEHVADVREIVDLLVPASGAGA